MNQYILLDGAMGTMLQQRGLALGEYPEIFGLNHPEVMEEIYKAYLHAGSQVIYANTFGANPMKLKDTDMTLEEVITGAIQMAKRVVKDQAKVALDVGPLGALMAPLGDLSFEQAYAYYQQIVVAGAKAGADLIVFETMSDLYEVKAAVLAAKEHTTLPVWVTMSFEANGRTFTGTSVACMALTLDRLGVDAMGMNCSLGPVELKPLMAEMRRWTNKPLILKPNAGLPDPAKGTYMMDADAFAKAMDDCKAIDIQYIGGCCGTSPAYIEGLAALEKPSVYEGCALNNGVCSSGHMTDFGGVRVIGERINPTGKKRFAQALREGDMNYIMARAIEQAEAGVDILDINVGLPGIDEPAMMVQVVKAVQSVTDLPLQIDSSDPLAIEAGLRVCQGRAIVNSVNAEPDVLDSILPIVHKYGAAVVGLTMNKQGIPQTAEGRIELAGYILDAARKYHIPDEDVLIDCLTLTISAQQAQAKETLKAVAYVHQQMGLHTVLGVSNISFGLPGRIHVTTGFLTQAMYCGLDLPIVNPNQKEIMDAVYAYRALSGEDMLCQAYIQRFAETTDQKTEVPAAKAAEDKHTTLEEAVLKGLKDETARLVREALQTASALDIINLELIPALDTVGELYEKQKLFLPQLILSANAACAGFDIIKEYMAGRGDHQISKGKIIMATVEGDIHDLGKNIVKVVLENYGYQVIDLGTDVPPAKVLETAIEHQVKLVALSALMTTTVVSMKKTIELMRASGYECTIMVGGAVLTPEYAEEIGADYYTKDAKASVDVAKKVLG